MITRPAPRLAAALIAAGRGWPVFPLHPYSKHPAVRDWEHRATCDPEEITHWWAAAPYNIGIACGPAGLVVLDLDTARSRQPPPAWAEHGVTHGRDVLRILAEHAAQPDPADTYCVATPSGGSHHYFLAPAGRELRNTTGGTGSGLGWLIDTRAAGGAIVAAGSVRRINGTARRYRVLRDVDPIELPPWLLTALTPAPPRVPAQLPASGARLDAYLRTVLDGETSTVARAAVGTRAHTLFRSAARLGELIGAGVLDQTVATEALLAAAAALDTPEAPFTRREAAGHITNGITRGRRNPRRLPGARTAEQ